jgi:hypothetical protein
MRPDYKVGGQEQMTLHAIEMPAEGKMAACAGSFEAHTSNAHFVSKC